MTSHDPLIIYGPLNIKIHSWSQSVRQSVLRSRHHRGRKEHALLPVSQTSGGQRALHDDLARLCRR